MFLFNIGFLEIEIWDVLDIALVGILIYQLFRIVRGTLASYILVGFLLLFLASLLVKSLEMEMLAGILGGFMGLGLVALLIVFQPEIRRFLLLLGKQSLKGREEFRRFFAKDESLESSEFDPSDALIDAVKRMSEEKTGALIVLGNEKHLVDYLASGTRLSAQISENLLCSIFFKNAPLHDGALLIYNRRIQAAQCILPVTGNKNLPKSYGLRHRAAVGVSERMDVLAICVSEESGNISFATKGYLTDLNQAEELRGIIKKYLGPFL